MERRYYLTDESSQDVQDIVVDVRTGLEMVQGQFVIVKVVAL